MTEHRELIADVLAKAPFIRDLGVELLAAGEGWVETRLRVLDRLRQQHGFAHAGVVTTLADHTAGAAASTVVPAGMSVLTADFTMHLLRPGSGELLTCRGEVLRPGRTLIVVEADVLAEGKLSARYTGTMAVVDRPL